MMKGSGSQILVVISVLIVPSYITLVLRCYVRWTRNTWGADDSCMVAAAALFTWFAACCISGALHGFSTKDEDFTGGIAQLTKALLDWFMYALSYIASTVIIKISIAAQQIRIASSRPGYVWFLRILMGSYSCFMFGASIYFVQRCRPLKYSWDKTIPDGKCDDTIIMANLGYAVSSFNILTDCTCALLPIPLVWNLKMNRNAKIAAVALLSLGIFASVCAIVRLKYSINLAANMDFFYSITPIVTLSFAEASIGMMASNLSTLRPLVTRLLLPNGTSVAYRNNTPPTIGTNKRRIPGWLSGYSTRHSSHAGAIELSDGSTGFVHTVVELGHVQRTQSESSIGDNESRREILRGNSAAMGGIRVRRELEFDQTPTV